MKSSFFVCWLTALSLVFAARTSGTAQTGEDHRDAFPPLRIESAFVWVPAVIRDGDGGALPNLDVSRLRLLDNGFPEKTARIDTDGLPISLVILMQTGGSARRFLPSYSNLPWLINQWVGESVHEITLVTFDSRIEQIWHFPTRTDGAIYAMTHQPPGDDGAAIRDAVAFGVRQLQEEPGRFRRVVLLLCEGADVASSTPSRSVLEQLGTSSTVVYSLTFPGGKKLARAREEKQSDSTEQVLVRTRIALDGQTAEEVANLTGGSNHEFNDQASFNSAMLEALSDFRNGITLGFQPHSLQSGFHRIEVLIDSSKLRVTARRAYWSIPSN